MTHSLADFGARTHRRSAAAIAFEAATPPALLAVGMLSGSLTLLGEGMRSGFLLALRILPRVGVLGRAGGAPVHYEFGLGKLEQSGNFALSALLMAVGLWFAGLSLDLMFSGQSGAGPLNLAFAAAALAVQLCRCALALRALLDLSGERGSPAAKTALRGAAFEFLYLLLLQSALTVAVLSKGPLVSHWADLLGGCAAAFVMAVTGIRRSWEALMDLIDYPLGAVDRELISEIASKQGIDIGSLVSLRTRRAGRQVFVELSLDLDDALSMQRVQDDLGRLRQAMNDALDGIDVVVRLDRTV